MAGSRAAALVWFVTLANAQSQLDQMVPAWQSGSQEAPATFSEWKGAFHDGSGPYGTYSNNQDSWYLINPCAKETAEGRPCRVLLWFDLFDSEGIYDTLTVFDGSTEESQIALLSGGADKVNIETTLIRSSQPALLLHFVSDAYRSFQGFTIHYKTDQDATLSHLVSGVQLSPTFSPAQYPTTEYFGQVPHEQTNTTLMSIMNDQHPYSPWVVSHPAWDSGYTVPAATMRLNGVPWTSNNTKVVELDSGSPNIFVISLTACDMTTVLEFKVDIDRPADVEAHLRTVEFSTGPLVPEFDPDLTVYNTSVIYEIADVVVTAMSEDIDVQSIWVGVRGTEGQIVAPGVPSLPVELANGERNAVDVVVTAEDGIHVMVYTNYITRPRFSLSQFERQFLTGEWRRSQHGDTMLLTLGGHWDPCADGEEQEEEEEEEDDEDGAVYSATDCRENSWELITIDYDGRRHEMRGWYEVNTFQSPVMLNLDVLEATGDYSQLRDGRLQGWYRLTDWPVPSTDGLSTSTRTHVNMELDLAWCTSLAGTNATVDTSIDTTMDIVGAEMLVAPESTGPYGTIPWSCPRFSTVLGNDTSHFYVQVLRDVDECKDGTHECSTDAICTNTYGSRWCACRSGYDGNPYFDMCEDIDECAQGTHNCGEHTYCINTPGSFNCSCSHGHEGNPSVYTFDVDVTPDGSIDVVKKPGLEWECVSVHENHTCQHVPTVYPQRDGSVRGGRTGSFMDTSRVDDQEQMWHFDDPPNPEYPKTSQHYYREKTDPDYVRELTESVPYPPPRWHFDGAPAADNECSDIDECATESHGCSDNGYCFNVPGSFSCHCHIGYKGDPYEAGGCSDIDECQTETHACSENSNCINIPGSHLCECPGSINHNGQLFWNDRVPGKPYNSRCHMPLRQSRAFVTYERWTGEQVGTLNGADAKCHSEGPELQPGFRWKAVLSDQGTSAIHHLTAGDTNILYPVLRTDGELVAVDSDQLWNGLRLPENTVRGDKQYFGLSNPINVDGSGARIPDEPEWTGAHEVWTGSDVHGSRFEHGSCWSWREQSSFTQNQAGGAEPTADGGAGHIAGTIYSGHHAGTVGARSPIFAGDVWNYDGPVDSDLSYSKAATSVPAGAGGSYGDLRSTFKQWHTSWDTLRECETKRRRLFCMEVHYSTRSVLRDPKVSPFGTHMNSTWWTASASTVINPNDVYPVQALDGDNTTFWQASLSDTDVWFQVDMHAHYTVTAVLLQWHSTCFPAAYALMLSNSAESYPIPPTSKFAGWSDPSLQDSSTQHPDDPNWRIYHEIISRTWRGGDQRLDQPSLLARSVIDRQLVKDPSSAVTAISPPEVARHVRVMVTDPNDLQCHGLAEVMVFSPEERPFGSYSESARRAVFRGLQGDGVEQSRGGQFPRSSNPSLAGSTVDGGRGYNDRDAWPTPSDGSVSYTSGTDRHTFEQPAAFPQVTSHAPPGWEFIQLRARSRATDLQRETRYDNMRHRYTQADSKLNDQNADHAQYPCPPGVMSCDSREPSSQEGHKRQDEPTPNMPTVLNYEGEVVGCTEQGGCTSAEPADKGFAVSGSNQNRYSQKVLVGGPSQGYRPRGSQDGDIPGDAEVQNTSPLRQHNAFRGTVPEYDDRAETSATAQPMHPTQRKASMPDLEGPQWKPSGPKD
jgi:hypothetical protein